MSVHGWGSSQTSLPKGKRMLCRNMHSMRLARRLQKHTTASLCIRLVVIERKNKSAAPSQACVFVGAFQLRDAVQLLKLSRCIKGTAAQDAFTSPWQCQAGSAKPHEKERRKIVDTIVGKGFTHTLGM